VHGLVSNKSKAHHALHHVLLVVLILAIQLMSIVTVIYLYLPFAYFLLYFMTSIITSVVSEQHNCLMIYDYQEQVAAANVCVRYGRSELQSKTQT
jgi:hypothetical protein